MSRRRKPKAPVDFCEGGACRCFQDLAYHYRDQLMAFPPNTDLATRWEFVRNMELAYFVTYSCIKARHPNPEMQAWAKKMLGQELFDELNEREREKRLQ